MEKTKAIVDAGPIIHLSEIDKIELLSQFVALTTPTILRECKDVKNPNIKVVELTSSSKDFVMYVASRYHLEFGEATGIALCRQEKIKLFFTDDLEAREAAKTLGFDAHGTLAIILRALRKKIIDKKQAISSVGKLYQESSLFITKDLVDWTIEEIKRY